RKTLLLLSVPSSSGNTLQRSPLARPSSPTLTFSPLFIGEYSATRIYDEASLVRQISFQSPLHRGILCNVASREWHRFTQCLSVPSSSGNTLQLSSARRPRAPRQTFSPLFIGEYSATDESASELNNLPTFQSPLHRGILCNAHCGCRLDRRQSLSVPSSSGNTLQRRCSASPGRCRQSFSPLFIGEYSATRRPLCLRPRGCQPFSPLFIGEYSATTANKICFILRSNLSVPSSSGNTLQPALERLGWNE